MAMRWLAFAIVSSTVVCRSISETRAHRSSSRHGVAYNVDRMFGYCTGNGGSGQRITSAGVSGTPSLYAYQFTGAVGVTGIGFGQRIRAANSFDLAGGSATLSVNLANSLLTTVTWTAYYATATDNFSSLTSISTGTFTVTSTLTNYAATISVPSAATTGIEILLTVGAQTSGTWTIGDLQLEPGGHVTPFERRPNELEQHLCEAYCPVITGFGILRIISHRGIRLHQFRREWPILLPIQNDSKSSAYGDRRIKCWQLRARVSGRKCRCDWDNADQRFFVWRAASSCDRIQFTDWRSRRIPQCDQCQRAHRVHWL